MTVSVSCDSNNNGIGLYTTMYNVLTVYECVLHIALITWECKC